MELRTILGLVGSLLGGGALGAVINGYFTSQTEDKRTDLDATDRLVKHWEELLKPLRDRVDQLETALEDEREISSKYRTELSSLRNKLMIFESSHFDLPLPMWMKDVKGRMIFMNDVCQDLVLAPLNLNIEDYLGKTDSEFWGEDFGKQFAKTDAKVLRTKKPLEVVHTFYDATNTEIKAMVLKYPRFHGNEIIGVGGLIKYIIDDENSINKKL